VTYLLDIGANTQVSGEEEQDAMTKVLLRDQLAAALVKRGERQLANNSEKYLVFTRKEGGFRYLGRSGSLRHGRTFATSYPAPDNFKKQLQNGDYSQANLAKRCLAVK
jgi:hypothetical protein